jgi:hypothetical protein
VDRAPRRRGVYALYTDRALVYVGRALGGEDTIRARLRAHLDHASGGATHYKRELTPKPKARRKVLLEEFVTAQGRLPRLNAAHA